MKLKLFFMILFVLVCIRANEDDPEVEEYQNSRINDISYPDSLKNNPNIPLQKVQQKINIPESFNIDKLKTQFEEFDCLQRFKDNDLAMQQCLNKLEQSVFGPFENFNSPNSSIYGTINKDIYIPLAYNSFKQSSYADIIKELIFKNNDDNLLNDQDIKLDFDDFQYSIIQNLSQIENKSDYNNENQKDIINGIINILKDFHIYWNGMRLKNQVTQASKNTIKVIENIIKKYQVKESFMFQLTKILVLKLESAFQRFIRAHYSLIILKENVSGIIGNQIIKRYIGLTKIFSDFEIEDIKQGFLTKNSAVIIDFAKIYLINLYKEDHSVAIIKELFEENIIKQIKENYRNISQNVFKSEERKKSITHITAMILLKLQHVYFIFFNYNDIEEVINAEAGQIQPQKSLSVKIYYELMDNMVLLPGKCLDEIDLAICVYKKANEIFNHINLKYSLSYSRQGQIIYRYVRQLIQKIFSDASQDELSNLNLLKKFFYKNLFAKLFEYKIRFKIKDTMELDDLETQVGDMLMAYKLNTENELVHIDYKTLDQLDLDIYDKFLTIKAQFDDYVPIYQDKLAVLEVHDILCQFVDQFSNNYQNVLDENFNVLTEDLKKLFNHWREKMLDEYKKEHKKPEIKEEMIKKYPELFHLNMDKFKVYKENINTIHQILGEHQVSRQSEDNQTKEQEQQKEKMAQREQQQMENKKLQNDFIPFNKQPFNDLLKDKTIQPLKFDYQKPKNKHIIFNGVQGILGDSHRGPENIPSDIQHADAIDDYNSNPEHTVINNDSIGDIGLADGIQAKNSYKKKI